jgi:ABC-type lipoprotein release transport system permease subunit
MARRLNLLWWAIDGLLASPGRFVLAVLTIAVSLFWCLSGLALSEGLRREAHAALRGSADLFVSADAFGLDAPIAVERARALGALPGVIAAVPRIVGRARVDERWVVVAALDPAAVATLPLERRPLLPEPGTVCVGVDLASAMHWRAGAKIMLEIEQARVFDVARVFDAGSGLGSANAILLAFEDAEALFDRPGQVSDILLYCRPGYAARLAELIAADHHLRVQSSELVESYLDRAYTIRSGILMTMLGTAITLLVPLFLLISEFGLSSRRREIAILKASGWSTRDVLEMSLLENFLIAVGGTVTGFLLSYLWVAVLGAPWIRALYLAEGSGAAHVALPWHFGVVPLVIGATLALAITMTGGVISVWRSTTVPPAAAMRH